MKSASLPGGDRAEHPVPTPCLAETAHDPTVVWQQLVSGRLRIVDSYDRHRRRYLVVKPGTEGRPAMSARERKALALRAEGCALKVIAIELAVSPTTAARDIRRGMASLGLQSATELAAMFNHGLWI